MAKKKAPAEKAPAPKPEPAEPQLSPVEMVGGLYALKLRELAAVVDSIHIEDLKTRLRALADELASIHG